MQEASGGWTRESFLSPESLGSLRELNHRFLELEAARQFGSRDARGRVTALTVRLAPLSRPQRAAAADCPYALFDLRFDDGRHWRPRLAEASAWHVADEPAGVAHCAGECGEFARLAIFYAWHVASGAALSARLLLGMGEDTAAALRRVKVSQLPLLAAGEAKHLSARFGECSPFWDALTGAAARADAAALRRVQLYGLQIAAAAGLGDR